MSIINTASHYSGDNSLHADGDVAGLPELQSLRLAQRRLVEVQIMQARLHPDDPRVRGFAAEVAQLQGQTIPYQQAVFEQAVAKHRAAKAADLAALAAAAAKY